MSDTIDRLEKQRLALQSKLDEQKTQTERNRHGQFATPTPLALEILKHAATLLPPTESVRFLDPAIGTGAFYSALRKVFSTDRVAEALGFEIDQHYGKPASRLWRNSNLKLKLSDFTKEEAAPRFNLIVCNPPYVRHHHLQNADKNRLRLRTLRASGMKISGLAGLYCHFLGLTHAWMAKGAIASWLIPSEFMDVNYGRAIKSYLLKHVTLLHIHRFDPAEVQFADALVSSAIVWFRNIPPKTEYSVAFTFGGTLLEPKLSRTVSSKELADEPKWTRFPASDTRSRSTIPTLSDFFQIKRGLATGDNAYFILREDEIRARHLPMTAFRPILPSPRYLPQDEVDADEHGNPTTVPRLFLMDTRLAEDEVKERYPALWAYLEEGRARALDKRYLCSHRSPWYSQENRPPAPLVCTYLGRRDTKRGRPFRFILNNSRATVANVYLAMYPTLLLVRSLERNPLLIRRIWELLNQLTPEQLLGEGRVYGGGLHKLEPRELANVNASAIADLIPDFQKQSPTVQFEMFG